MNHKQRPSSQDVLLVSDMDDTLTGDTDAIQALITIINQTPHLEIVINSSRPADSIDHTLQEQFVGLEPLGIITAMGTEIRLHGEALTAWKEHLGAWPREAFTQVMEQLGHQAHAEEYQTEYKASYAVEASQWFETKAKLEEIGIPCLITMSGQSDFDITVSGAGKDQAAQFLATHLGYGLDKVIVAGDSGNDLKMFQAFEKGIVVGNARTELKEKVNPDTSYTAKNDHAQAIIEGLRHYGVID